MPWPNWLRRRTADVETPAEPGQHHTLAELDRNTLELLRQEWGAVLPDPNRVRRWRR